MTPTPVLIVDDEGMVRNALNQWLSLSGFAVTAAADAREAMAKLVETRPLVVITDVRMPFQSGMQLLTAIKEQDPTIAVILITGHGDVPMAVKAMREGAFDFLQKPYEPEHLVTVIERAANQARLQRELLDLRRRLDGGTEQLAGRLIGPSPAMEEVRNLLLDIAAIDTDVIIQGETGTGKEVVARCLHDFSSRAKGPFVAVNCAAIPAELIESELFGHESGAFTGSAGVRIGKFEFANHGTLLLDEIEGMPLLAQAKVLRVIQERTVERLGSNRQIPLDLRIIAATKVNLEREANAGRFRADLYFRLNSATLDLPPLRERGDDCLFLFQHFLALAERRFNKTALPLHPADIGSILSHPWPGNVRELKAAADRYAMGLSRREQSMGALLGSSEAIEPSLGERVARYERRIIEDELRRQHNSIAAVCLALGVPRRTLTEKMSRLGVTRKGAG